MQLVMPFAPPTSYDASDYIRGEANAAALALMEQWPDWAYSIVLVYGPKGCGKTHLAHLFASRARASFLAPERIGTRPADQLLTGNHVWVIDEIEKVVDAPALAQLINHARARGDYVLMTANMPAAELPFALPDLRSRLLALPAIGLAAPDDALLMGVLAKQFADRQLRIAPEVLQFAANHIERSYAAVQEFVKAMDELSLERGRSITIALVREGLKNPSWQDV